MTGVVNRWQPGDRICPACGAQTPCACCHHWTGTTNRQGYGTACWGEPRDNHKGRKSVLVHRWTYIQAHGPIPDGMVVMHICDVPACYFLGHLRCGTVHENNADAWMKGSHPWVANHPGGVTSTTWMQKPDNAPCPQGHVGDFARSADPRQGRYCRICKRESAVRYRYGTAS